MKQNYSQCQPTPVFTFPRECNPSLGKVIADYQKLTERILELCEKDLDPGKPVSLATYFKPLKRLLEDRSIASLFSQGAVSLTYLSILKEGFTPIFSATHKFWKKRVSP